MTGPPLVRDRRHGRVLEVRFGRPDAVNPLDPPLLDALADAVARIAGDDEIRCAVLIGTGRSFAAGADLHEVLGQSVADNVAYGLHLRGTFDAVAACPKPIVAAINGFALGGGLELALACTLRVAAAGVVLGLPEVRLGLIASAGGVPRLPRAIGPGAALELMLTGEHVDADRALALGLVQRVSPPESLLDDALALAARIADNSPAAVQACVRLVAEGGDLPLADALERADAGSAGVLDAGEWREGIAAFLERRPADFTATQEMTT